MARSLFAALVLVLLSLAGPVRASGGAANPAGADNYLEISPTALPVIVDGKVKNYVFVQMRLLPGPGADLISLREFEPHYRDALVRAAHRTPFNRPEDWTVLDAHRLTAVLLTEARRISGPRAFAGAVVLRQTPRRRTGMARGR